MSFFQSFKTESTKEQKKELGEESPFRFRVIGGVPCVEGEGLVKPVEDNLEIPVGEVYAGFAPAGIWEEVKKDEL